jgi:hypothetical protein
MSSQRCSVCGKSFQKNESGQVANLANVLGRDASQQLCYNCALEKVTGGSCPEEGDFNTARLISGEMTDQERKWLMEDLRAVECPSEDDDDYDDYDRYHS